MNVTKKKREIIKIGVLLKYGTHNLKLIEKALRSENTKEKLQAMYTLLNQWDGKEEELLFVLQKLLAYPKKTRISIADQLFKYINKSKD